jgi:hypothetical protein
MAQTLANRANISYHDEKPNDYAAHGFQIRRDGAGKSAGPGRKRAGLALDWR